MADMNQAVHVTTDVEIDWAELGRVFADESSPRQADFFMGFYEGVVDMQLAYIASERVFDGERGSVADMIEMLAAFIRDDGASR